MWGAAAAAVAMVIIGFLVLMPSRVALTIFSTSVLADSDVYTFPQRVFWEYF